MKTPVRLMQTFLASVLATGVTAAYADSMTLTGAQEVPAVDTSATAKAHIVIKPDRSISGTIKTAGIEGTMAHVHLGETGKNGPPIVTLTKSADNTWSIPAGTQLTEEQYQSYKDGKFYVNVHSEAHKGGEIRTQLKP